VRGLSFLPAGRRLVSLGDDGLLKIWDLLPGQELLSLHAHTRNGIGLTISPDGGRIATSGAEGNVLVWDATPLVENGDEPPRGGFPRESGTASRP
jgi:WD40 repeat protein